MSRPRSASLLPAQVAAALLCFAMLAAWPPATGRMMLVPLTAGGSPAGSAIAAGALLLGSGPLPGSLVVVGERRRIAAALASQAVLVLAAPPAGCGAATGEEGIA